MATDVVSTIGSTGGDYTTLSAWEAGEQRNLVTADKIAVAECYDDWGSGLSDSCTVNGWTTDATRYAKITVANGHRHGGIPKAGFYMVETVQFCIPAIQQYTVIEYVECENNTTSFPALRIDGTAVLGRHCIAKNTGGSGAAAIAVTNTAKVHACLAYSSDRGINLGGTSVALNSVAAKCTTRGFWSQNNTATAKNCVAYSNGSNWVGTFNVASTHNATSSGSDDAPGGNSVISVASGDFANAASNNFHLSSGSKLRGAGTNLYSDLTTDIDGNTWPSSGAWDIGFDYYLSGVSTYTLSAATYAPGSITKTGVTPRVTVTVA